MPTEVKCQRCGEICLIDGEYPRFFAYCDTCDEYVEGFDILEFAADYLGSKIDEAEMKMENR